MKNLFLVLSLLVASNVFAAYSTNYGRDINLPTQKVLEKISMTPVLATTCYILTSNNGDTTGAGATVTTFTHQPDVPRVLTVTTASQFSNVAAGNVVITGTNIYGKTITDTLAITENQNGTTTGTKAFKTVSKIVFPAEDTSYMATWIVGTTSSVGLDHCMTVAGDVAWATVNGAYEGTRPTCTANAYEVEKNVCSTNTAYDGSKKVQFYYVQNFICTR